MLMINQKSIFTKIRSLVFGKKTSQIKTDLRQPELPNFDISENFSGTKTILYDNGKLKAKGDFLNGKPEGKFETFYDNGKLDVVANYVDGTAEGEYLKYHSNGKINIKANCSKGYFHGDYNIYNWNGVLRFMHGFDKGLLHPFSIEANNPSDIKDSDPKIIEPYNKKNSAVADDHRDGSSKIISDRNW